MGLLYVYGSYEGRNRGDDQWSSHGWYAQEWQYRNNWRQWEYGAAPRRMERMPIRKGLHEIASFLRLHLRAAAEPPRYHAGRNTRVIACHNP